MGYTPQAAKDVVQILADLDEDGPVAVHVPLRSDISPRAELIERR